MRTVDFELNNQTWHLCMNGAALFDLYERFGDGDLLSHITGGGKEAYENTCTFLEKLAEQGELVRRYQGYDTGPLPTRHMFRTMLSPKDFIRAKDAVAEAIVIAFGMEEKRGNGEVDLGLQEFEKKTETG